MAAKFRENSLSGSRIVIGGLTDMAKLIVALFFLRYTSIPPYVVMALYLTEHRNTFFPLPLQVTVNTFQHHGLYNTQYMYLSKAFYSVV